MTFESLNQSNKPALDLIGQFEELLDTDVSISKHVDTEYVLTAEGLTRLVLDIDPRGRTMTIVDIEAESRGAGVGREVVGSLVEVASENGYRLVAQDVSPGLDSWWRAQGFAPPADDEQSADYEYGAAGQ